NAIKDFLGAVFKGDWEGAWTSLKEIAVNALKYIRDETLLIWDSLPIPEATKTKIENVLTSIKDGAVGVFTWIYERGKEAWEGIKASVEENGAGVIEAWDSLKEAGATLWNALKKVFDSIAGIFGSTGESSVSFKDIVKGAFDIILTVVTTVLGGIADLMNIFAAALRGDWSQVWTEFKNFLSGIWDGIVKILDIIGLKDAIIAGWEALKLKTTEIWQGIKDSLSGVWSGIVSWFDDALQDLIDTVTGWMPGWLQTWLGVGEDAGTKAAEGLDNSNSTVKQAATDLKDTMVEAATPSDKEAQDIGHKLAAGTVVGWTDSQSMAVINAGATKLTDAQIKALNEAAGAHSPAEKFMPVGEAETEGVVVGMLNAANLLIETGKKMIEDTTAPMKETAQEEGEETGTVYTDSTAGAIEKGAGSVADATDEVITILEDGTDKLEETLASLEAELAKTEKGSYAYAKALEKLIKFHEDLIAAAEYLEDQGIAVSDSLLALIAATIEYADRQREATDAVKSALSPMGELRKKYNELVTAMGNMREGSLAHAGALKELQSQYDSLMDTIDFLQAHNEKVDKSIWDQIAALEKQGVITRDTAIEMKRLAEEEEAAEKATRELEDAQEEAARAAEEHRDSIKDLAKSLLQLARDAVKDVIDGFRKMREAAEDHVQAMADIETDYIQDSEDVEQDHTDNLETAQQRHTRKVEDIERRYRRKLRDLVDDDGTRRAKIEQDYHDDMEDEAVSYARTRTDIEQTYTDDMTQAEKDREQALADEKAAYEENKITIPQIVGDMM
ncbi:MAG: hypothetical protein JRD89_05985, partial [Deltaproteobacteria bacterium]|nr:hypothetical protein [Deltaproteobacteria bacterium]